MWRPMDIATMIRFGNYVDTRSDDVCWLWTGGQSEGYGQFNYRDAMGCPRVERAHRVMWRLTFGPPPPGMCVLHRCDVRRCCNPAHLFLGTRTDNMADKMAKGRGRGPTPKIPPTAISAIRASTEPAPVVAARYGVSRSLITAIRRGERRASA